MSTFRLAFQLIFVAPTSCAFRTATHAPLQDVLPLHNVAKADAPNSKNKNPNMTCVTNTLLSVLACRNPSRKATLFFMTSMFNPINYHHYCRSESDDSHSVSVSRSRRPQLFNTVGCRHVPTTGHASCLVLWFKHVIFHTEILTLVSV